MMLITIRRRRRRKKSEMFICLIGNSFVISFLSHNYKAVCLFPFRPCIILFMKHTHPFGSFTKLFSNCGVFAFYLESERDTDRQVYRERESMSNIRKRKNNVY